MTQKDKMNKLAVGLVISNLVVGTVMAHELGFTLDGAGNNPNAVALGAISCGNDGNGPADRLTIQITDLSVPVSGMLLSAQILKNNKMINVTDPVSGDGKGSSFVSLKGGAGSYYVSINKTAEGSRNVFLTYHCETAEGNHTGTDVVGYQLD